MGLFMAATNAGSPHNPDGGGGFDCGKGGRGRAQLFGYAPFA
jgi:hypothetical protein